MSAPIAEFLRSTELFGDLQPEILARISTAFQSAVYPEKTVVFEQGTAGQFLYVILRGEIELRRRDPLTGVEVVLYSYGTTKSFGEEITLNEDPAPFFAVARAESELLLLPKGAFRKVVEQLPSVGLGASSILSRRASRLYADKGVRFITLSKVTIDKTLLSSIPRKLMQDHQMLPIGRRGRTLTLAMVNPHDLGAYDQAKRAARCDIEVVGVSSDDFEKTFTKVVIPALDNTGPTTAQAENGMAPRVNQKDLSVKFIQFGAENAADDDKGAMYVGGDQVIQLMNAIVGEGITLEASDIHIQPQEKELVVKYRIDGRLLRRPEETSLRFHPGLASRLKALAAMDITEKRKPQDGRLGVRVNNVEVALRISTVPTPYGENIVIRVLNKSAALMSLDRIVNVPSVRDMIRSMVFQPYGLMAVTGPTGSGKSTTMYSALLERKDEATNIVTIEDPIEYTIGGITQVQLNESIELGYNEAIRAFLRQDTDVMMIGEIRDARTAQHAMQAALTGHLVVTSLHTNSAMGTLERLAEMGVEASVLGNALAGVVAQRLVRQICQDCREPATYDAPSLQRIYGKAGEVPPLFRGRGCRACNGTGYRGRVAIYEVLRINEELRAGISARQPLRELRDIALRNGMITLREYSKYLLGRGLTTPTEVLRVLLIEDEQVSADSVTCPSCNYRNEPGNKFCEECGHAL